ncbi:MAG TPA: hypothetical protein QGI40_06680, partial [Nitrospinaceae bacterium]|nr:hypothetical protein [Nitrospinaceae bacterium]
YRDALELTMEVGDKNGTAQDYTYIGNLKFKDGKIDEAEVNFDKAVDYFKEANNTPSLLQLFLTVARMELIVSRKEQSEKYLDQARIICKDLGDPEAIVKSIEEIEKVKDSVDVNR